MTASTIATSVRGAIKSAIANVAANTYDSVPEAPIVPFAAVVPSNPYLEANLDPGISRALVRSAALLRDDADALDAWADREATDLDCDRLAALPRAIRTRIIRKAALEAGTTPGQLTFEQIGAIDALICAWKGQGAVSLAGGVKVERISGRLSLSR